MSELSSKLDQKTLDMLKTLLEKFQWALKNGEVKRFKRIFKERRKLFLSLIFSHSLEEEELGFQCPVFEEDEQKES